MIKFDGQIDCSNLPIKYTKHISTINIMYIKVILLQEITGEIFHLHSYFLFTLHGIDTT